MTLNKQYKPGILKTNKKTPLPKNHNQGGKCESDHQAPITPRIK